MAKSGMVTLLANIGAIVSIVLAALDAFGYGIGWGWWGWFGWIWLAVVVLLALGVLYGTGLLKKYFFTIATEFLPLLIVGIIIFAPGGNWGGLVLIVAALFDKFA
ncbi:MAG: hypothetical protein JW839_09450 [Candidatus Lokiarchaeota archaeon]|nr:hypothetical protein [Candidatus Lokiarchaeota archaeon]